jgi:hypothetical protein
LTSTSLKCKPVSRDTPLHENNTPSRGKTTFFHAGLQPQKAITLRGSSSASLATTLTLPVSPGNHHCPCPPHSSFTPRRTGSLMAHQRNAPSTSSVVSSLSSVSSLFILLLIFLRTLSPRVPPSPFDLVLTSYNRSLLRPRVPHCALGQSRAM